MAVMRNEDFYLTTFEDILNKKGMKNFKEIETYFKQIKSDVLNCITKFSQEAVWENIVQLIILDEKLVLLHESLNFMEYYGMTEAELIEMVEEESKHFNKENWGYSLNQSEHFSLIFPSNFIS
ncbi:hypothetical protein GUI51_13380 [Enterococcus mundtii]|uniref:Uncharacterized protein n=1 Tax=Enterococcus mundtii TaxID=53346 RepID=A0ABQ0VGY9_ENTMU|nr:hypothetical protein [Enterococcus mundtii]MZU11520.1 hypothetical protein [Bifidobacterium longum]GEN18605.1 hypothetical protein LAC02_18860 [Ligilactobacillus acidipiscis]AUB54436.1 hypothetical protein EM4838_15575 [Enterococcus mundtii]MZZ60083.1 hypothetical protein [Enterococcus mundtii]MZZ63087.1 hypothetical protein [Enterococcus mundtii]